MPTWGFHIKTANKIAEKMKLKEKEKELFILANLIPDIKSGYLFETDARIPVEESHFHMEGYYSIPDIEKYREKYWKKGDLILTGIYCHLLLDYYMNMKMNTEYFVYDEKSEVNGIKTVNGIVYGTKKECNQFKHDSLHAIANSFDIKTDYNFRKRPLLFKTDVKSYTITIADIFNAEMWLRKKLKENKGKENVLFTDNEVGEFLDGAVEFILQHIE